MDREIHLIGLMAEDKLKNIVIKTEHIIVIFSELFTLILLVPCISESCIEMKIKLNFYFRTSLWGLKRFYEGLKVGLSSYIYIFICFNDSPSNMMKNDFYFILKALFALKIFKFFSWLFRHVQKTAWLER